MLRDLIRRSFWLALGAAAGRLLPLLVLLLASRQMETRQFASASAAYAWAGVAMSLTSAGLATVMTQRLAATFDTTQQRQLFGRHFRLSMLWSLLLAMLVVAFGKHLGGQIFGAALDPVVVVPAALSGALWSQVVVCVAALNGSHQARAASLALASCGLLQGLGMAIAMVGVGSDAQALAWGLFVGSAAALVSALFLLKTAQRVTRWGDLLHAQRDSSPASRAALWRSPLLWISLASALVLPVSFFASSLIAHGADGVRQLAQYFALEQVHQALVYLPAVVGQALLPVISRRLGLADASAQGTLLLRNTAFISLAAALIGLLLAAALTANVAWLVRLLASPALGAGDEWAVRCMVLNAALGLSLSITGGAILGSGWIIAAGISNLVWSALFVGLTAALAEYGNLGLQIARLTASAVLAVGAALALLAVALRQQPPRRPTIQPTP